MRAVYLRGHEKPTRFTFFDDGILTHLPFESTLNVKLVPLQNTKTAAGGLSCEGQVSRASHWSRYWPVVAGLFSTAITGKGLEDQALSLMTGKDCNIFENILHKKRKLCEEPGSVATADDFKGVFVAFGGSGADPLERMARARQEELAEAQIASDATPVAVEPASAITLPFRVHSGLPKKGEPAGLVRLGDKFVFAMPPVDESAQQNQPATSLVAASTSGSVPRMATVN